MEVTAFVVSQLPPVPARVLEVGCGEGKLARALAAAGYGVTAIDPLAPDGEIFRPVALEDLEEGPFDAVVAVRSLHHVDDLALALDKIVHVLSPGGVLVLEEFGWDRLDAATAEWFYGRRRVLAAAGTAEAAPASVESCRREWEEEHVGLHGYEAMREGLDRRFGERYFEWTPYLYALMAGRGGEQLERALIDAGAIAPLGFRYAGTVRRD